MLLLDISELSACRGCQQIQILVKVEIKSLRLVQTLNKSYGVDDVDANKKSKKNLIESVHKKQLTGDIGLCVGKRRRGLSMSCGVIGCLQLMF